MQNKIIFLKKSRNTNLNMARVMAKLGHLDLANAYYNKFAKDYELLESYYNFIEYKAVA
jgi:hypothetical protein